MPILALLALILLLILLSVALLPLSLIQRYRLGTARRPARRWLATLNIVGLAASCGVFLTGAALAALWDLHVLPYALAGLGTGLLLGLAGLALTRWERVPGTLYYTPNRWLVLGITLVVLARLLYGFARGLAAWRAGIAQESWLEAAGVAGSMAAGAVVLGYYLMYWVGVRRRIRIP